MSMYEKIWNLEVEHGRMGRIIEQENVIGIVISIVLLEYHTLIVFKRSWKGDNVTTCDLRTELSESLEELIELFNRVQGVFDNICWEVFPLWTGGSLSPYIHR